ncbi:MAG: DUF4836 family protein [Chitinophagaceae bacterium]
MKRKLSPYFLLVLLVLVMASCSKKVNVPVPADASMVIHISGSSLKSKLSWDEFKKGELYKVASENIDDSLGKQILDNPAVSGIDIESDAFFFARSRGRGGYIAFTCSLKDDKAFAAMVKKVSHEDAIKTGDLYVIKDNRTVMTWNSNRFVFIADSPDLGADAFGSSQSTSSRSLDEDSLIKFANEVYTIKGSDAIGSNEKFASMMKESGDMHFYVNGGRFAKNSFGKYLSLTKASVLLDGNFTTATLNFDNGKITIDSKSYVNKDLAAIYKKYAGRKLDDNMLKKIPSNNINAVIAASYPPEGLKELIVLTGVDGIVNSFLEEMGYSMDEFIKANKGDILFSVSDFKIKKKEMKYMMGDKEQVYYSDKPDAKILFATSVKDKAAFQKMVNIVSQKINEQGGMFSAEAAKIPFSLKDDWFVAGNDTAAVEAFGTGSNNQAFISKISGHPVGAYIDIQKFIAGSKSSMEKDETASAIADQSMKFWQDIVFYGGEFKDEASEGHVEINLVDKTTNSLKQLNTYLGTMAKAADDRKKKDMQQWQNNTLPPDTVPTVMPAPKVK